MPAFVPVYCEIDDVKDRLFDQYGETATSSNDIDNKKISQAISAATRFIETHTHRKFYTVTGSRVYTPEFDDMCMIDDCVEITSIEVDADGDGIYEKTLTEMDYTTQPENNTDVGLPITAIISTSTFPTKARSIRITGTWGYSSVVPDDVNEACIIQSIRLFKRKDAPLGVAGSAALGQIRLPSNIDTDVELLLDFYIRRI